MKQCSKPNVLSVLMIVVWFALTAVSVYLLINYVELKPKVDENFFFSNEDPELEADKKIHELFPEPPQLILGVKGDLRSPSYLRKIEKLTKAIESLPSVFSVQSLSQGPASIDAAFKSPLWQRLLLSRDGKASFVSAFIKDVPPEVVIPKVEKIRDEQNTEGFEIMISGAPYIIELIRRNLLNDLKVFSIAAIIVFGVMLFTIFRSFWIILGTMLACFNAIAGTLLTVHLLRIHIGPLTANLSTIIFVLTLSHIVFMTFNWKRLRKELNTKDSDLRWSAVRMTLNASFWSMATTLLGFLSLLFVQATPLRQLGISGALGTVIAFLAAYLIYPWFLHAGKTSDLEKDPILQQADAMKPFWNRKHSGIILILIVLTGIAVTGIPRVDLDPNLMTYFQKDKPLRNGLEYIDKNGGSSPLKIVVEDQGGNRFNDNKMFKKLWKLHNELEKDDGVGTVVSLPLLLAEAKRSPARWLFKTEWLIQAMEKPKYDEIASYFVSKDRKQTLFMLRMKESERVGPRMAIIERIKKIIVSNGFNPSLIGGVYFLQGRLAEILSISLLSGLLLLGGAFLCMGWIISRSAQSTLSLVVSLAIIPAALFGIVGHFRIPVDVISSPAVNLAIAMGVDAMIHLIVYIEMLKRQGITSWNAWSQARRDLWKPILCASAIVVAGFGIFGLSSFPPTQRFGLSIVLGTLMAPLAALFILPWLSNILELATKES